jgi:hypothetical protein
LSYQHCWQITLQKISIDNQLYTKVINNMWKTNFAVRQKSPTFASAFQQVFTPPFYRIVPSLVLSVSEPGFSGSSRYLISRMT